MPSVPLLLAVTLVIGIAIGAAGAIPSMIVARRMPTRPALGTGAYAGGIVAGSTIAAAVAVPLAIGDDWRRTFFLVSVVSFIALAAWLVLVGARDPRPTGDLRRAIRLPWTSATGWLLVVVFGLQSILFYGIVAWLPNAYVERGWSTADAGALLAIFNGIGLITTIGVPLVADRLGTRRIQLFLASAAALVGLVGITLLPEPAILWVTILGLALGVVFPLVLTLPLDVSDDPGTTGAAAALMLLGGYLLAALGPIALGVARDATGDFTVSLWLLVVVAGAMVAACGLLSPERLRRGIARVPVLSSPA
jgi:CP family cyanate transporter-like MFS transporter